MLLAAGLRFSTLDLQSYWYNEAATALLTKLSLGDMLDRIPRMEGNPPLYYVLAWVWAKVFGTGEVGLRSLSAVCGTAMVPAAYAVGARLAGARAGVAVAALAACSPLLVWFSQEARPYILLALLTALALAAFLRSLESWRARDLAWWAGLSVLALGTHYFALVLIVPQAVWLVWRAPRRRPALLAIAPILAVCAALVPLASDQSSPATTSIPGALGTRIVELPKQLLTAYDAPAELALTVVAALLVLGGVWLAWARAEPAARRGAALMGGLGAVAVVGVILAALVGVDYLNTRNMIEAWLPLAAVPAIGFAAPRAGWAGPAGVVALCATFLVAVVSVDADRTFQRDDWRGAAHALGRATVPRAIVVTPGDGVLPLQVYLPRARPLRTGDRVQEIDVLGVALRRKQGEGPQQPTRIPHLLYPQFTLARARRDRLFLVARYRSPTPVAVSAGILQNSRASGVPALYLYEP
jgi:4-amino-4-deoxy-L-arabinose transferase-like glycosyltransferase